MSYFVFKRDDGYVYPMNSKTRDLATRRARGATLLFTCEDWPTARNFVIDERVKPDYLDTEWSGKLTPERALELRDWGNFAVNDDYSEISD